MMQFCLHSYENMLSVGVKSAVNALYMIPLCAYCIANRYAICLFYLSFSAWILSLLGVQYIIYLFNGECREM